MTPDHSKTCAHGHKDGCMPELEAFIEWLTTEAAAGRAGNLEGGVRRYLKKNPGKAPKIIAQLISGMIVHEGKLP